MCTSSSSTCHCTKRASVAASTWHTSRCDTCAVYGAFVELSEKLAFPERLGRRAFPNFSVLNKRSFLKLFRGFPVDKRAITLKYVSPRIPSPNITPAMIQYTSVLNPSYSVPRASRGRERGRYSDSGRVLGGEKEGAKCSVSDRVLGPFRVLGRGRGERSEREKARERSGYVSRFLPNLALKIMIALLFALQFHIHRPRVCHSLTISWRGSVVGNISCLPIFTSLCLEQES